jgi:hypothetical protein
MDGLMREWIRGWDHKPIEIVRDHLIFPSVTYISSAITELF